MKQMTLLSFFLFFVHILFADSNQKKVESKIEKVTVFLDGAQIIRSAKASLSTGKVEVVFGNLSPYIDKSSISVEAKGNFTVVSVTQEINHLNEQRKKDEIIQLEKRKENFIHQREEEENMKAVYDEGIEMLQKNQLVNSQHTDLKTADLKTAMEFHELKLAELKKSLLTYTRNIQKIADTIARIDAQLTVMNAKQDPSTSDLIVTVNAKQATEADFNISYFVNYAGWYPTYDLRVDDISKPMNISYRANVHQSTGENWKDVKLTLSNAEPKRSGVMPELNTWYITNGAYNKSTGSYGYSQYSNRTPDPNVTEVHGKVYDDREGPLPGATILVEGTTIGTTSDFNGNYSIKMPGGSNYLKVSYIGYNTQDIPVFSSLINIKMSEQKNSLNEVVVTGSKFEEGLIYKGRKERLANGEMDKLKDVPSYNIETKETFSPTTYSFDIEMPYSIPTDGKTYTVDIKEQPIPAEYIYVTTPKLDKEAFLMARITNWDDYNLLDGEANLYFEGTYLGKTLLNTSTEKDTLEISLGRDKSVSVTRTKLKDLSKRTFFGDKRLATRAFEIGIRNNKKQPINIMVLDQIPVSQLKEIEILNTEYKDAKLDEATGKLTWVLQIPASTDKKLQFKYQVKYPRNYTVYLE